MPLLPRSLLACATLLAMPGVAHADPPEADRFGTLHVNGYATLAATYADTDGQADFRTAQFQSFGSGRTRTWDFANDSTVAVQAIWNTPWQGVRAVGQVVVANDTWDDFTPRVDWAYLGWSPRDSVELRVGRFPFPSGLQAETRWVGSSRLEVRAPLAIYYALPLSALDGAELNWHPHWGDWAMRVRLLYGNKTTRLYSRLGDSEADIRDVLAASVEASQGPWRLFGGAFRSEVAVDSPGQRALIAALTAAATTYPPAGALAGDWTTAHRPVSQIDLGLEYVSAPWTLRAEAMLRFSDTRAVGNFRTAHLLAGYGLGAWTPFVALGAIYTEGGFDPEPVPAAPPPAVAALSAHNAALTGIADSRIASLGLHWAAAGALSVKLQWDHHWFVRRADGGTFINREPGFIGRDKPVNVFTLALDYAF